MSERTAGVVVAGAGIAGLAAAYELTRRRVPVTVLEAEDRAGGLLRTDYVEGFTLDAGPDSLLAQKPAALELCRELGIDSRLMPTQPPRTAFVLRAGRLHPLPERAVLGVPTSLSDLAKSRLFTFGGRLRMAADLVISAPDPPLDDESIGSFVRRRFGEEAVTWLAEPLLAGIHAGDVERLSIHALFPRLVEAEQQRGSVIRAFALDRRARPAPGPAFYSFPGGLEELRTGLLAALPPGSVRTGMPVTGIARTGAGWEVSAGGGQVLPAAAVVLAVPAWAASRVLSDLDRPLADACGEVPYASSATVALAYDRAAIAHPLDGTGYVVPRVEMPSLLAASWVSSKWTHRAPPGRVLIRAFLGGERDRKVLLQPDETLVRLTHDALSATLGIARSADFARVYRWTRAGAQHEVGHLGRLAFIDMRVTAQPGLFLTGAGFRASGIPDVVADARAAGRAAAAVALDG